MSWKVLILTWRSNFSPSFWISQINLLSKSVIRWCARIYWNPPILDCHQSPTPHRVQEKQFSRPRVNTRFCSFHKRDTSRLCFYFTTNRSTHSQKRLREAMPSLECECTWFLPHAAATRRPRPFGNWSTFNTSTNSHFASHMLGVWRWTHELILSDRFDHNAHNNWGWELHVNLVPSHKARWWRVRKLV